MSQLDELVQTPETLLALEPEELALLVLRDIIASSGIPNGYNYSLDSRIARSLFRRRSWRLGLAGIVWMSRPVTRTASGIFLRDKNEVTNWRSHQAQPFLPGSDATPPPPPLQDRAESVVSVRPGSNR